MKSFLRFCTKIDRRRRWQKSEDSSFLPFQMHSLSNEVSGGTSPLKAGRREREREREREKEGKAILS